MHLLLNQAVRCGKDELAVGRDQGQLVKDPLLPIQKPTIYGKLLFPLLREDRFSDWNRLSYFLIGIFVNPVIVCSDMKQNVHVVFLFEVFCGIQKELRRDSQVYKSYFILPVRMVNRLNGDQGLILFWKKRVALESIGKGESIVGEHVPETGQVGNRFYNRYIHRKTGIVDILDVVPAIRAANDDPLNVAVAGVIVDVAFHQ